MNQPTWIGQTLSGRYKIEELLGQGGMSAVYKAYDPNLKRVVAIKLVHSHLSSDPEFVKRFEEEASTVASLRHPNIVQVFDYNTDNGINYMVMEYVPGETLQDRLKRLNADQRRMSLKEAVGITVDICNALSYAHKRGMVHRDIKPANIMLDVNNHAILMDFGIVKILGGQSHTVTGAVMGTARYMPPEVVRSEPADPRSDIYALGITLYEMLSGKPPFDANSAMTVMMMHLNDPVPDLRPLRQDIDPRIAQVVLKALAKDRNLRFQSTDEFATALQNVLGSPNTNTVYPTVQPSGVNPGATSVNSQQIPVGNMRPQAGVTGPQSRPNPVPQTSGDYNTIYEQPVRSAASGQNPPIGGQPVQNTYGTMEKPQKSKTWMWIAGLGTLALMLVVGAVVVGSFVLKNLGGRVDLAGTQTQEVVMIAMTEAFVDPTQTSAPPTSTNTEVVASPTWTVTPENTATLAPTDIPVTPTPTYPPLYVKIDSIIINSSNQYEVAYETFGFTEVLPGQHIHFFFNTVLPENAGLPGSGPWILYGGPRPFTQYTIYQKPANATQMCALVANADHTIILESGNCVDLPSG